MTNVEGMTKPETRIAQSELALGHSAFLRHSSFIIRH